MSRINPKEAHTTRRGRELADKIRRHCDDGCCPLTWREFNAVCSLLCRLGKAIKTAEEIACSDERRYRAAEKRAEALTRRAADVAALLPPVNGQPWTVECPSLWPVLTSAGFGEERHGDDWGGQGWHLSS